MKLCAEASRVAVCVVASCWFACKHWVFWWDSNIQKRAQISEAHLLEMAVCRAAYEKATAEKSATEIATHQQEGVPMQYVPLVGTRVQYMPHGDHIV